MISEKDLSRIAYDPETGVFTALTSSGCRKVGDRLGYCKADGYRLIAVGGKWIYEHRLAWFIRYGSMPKDEIDHINGDRGDNRIANLRECSRSQNMMNIESRGVCFHKRQKKWVAGIRVKGLRYHLGTFTNEDDARRAYIRAAREMHGEFSRSFTEVAE